MKRTYPLALVPALLSLTSCATFLPGLDEPFDARDERDGSEEIAFSRSSPRRSRTCQGDLCIGMTFGEVRGTWGSPREVEVAGDSREGHQRWIYPLGGSPIVSAARVVYFESGRVAGWETLHP